MREKNQEYFHHRNSLFLLLNEEINKINTDHKKSGWTIWALLAALGTMTWILINQIEALSINWFNLGIIIIDGTFVLLFILSLSAFLKIKGTKSDDLRYQTGKDTQINSSSSYFVAFFWIFLVLILVYTNKLFVSNISRLLSYIVLVFYIIISLNFLIVRKLKFLFLPKDPSFGNIGLNRANWILRLTLIITIILISISGFEWIRNSVVSDVFKVQEVKTAFLIFGIGIVTYLVFSQSPNSRLIHHLVQIRRNLALTDISNEEIVSEIDIAIKGQKFENYLSSDISEIAQYNLLFEKELEIVHRNLYENFDKDSLENNFSKHSKELVFRSLVYAAKIEIDQIQKIINILKIKGKLVKMIGGNPHSENVILQNIFNRNKENREKYNNLVKKYYDIIKINENHEEAKQMIVDLKKYVPQLKYSTNTGEILE
ncbi:hypothetical protein LZ575_10525 [Antarcticibacterium sp. 1MA-6-2]|uniref:hypothetical protein n=1 Tax=Antarcticibacterium sp. 1MA-6-2 TaxID=2908210 RepID=UPI001F2D85B2|nr:hypothetical protein [Antarcticibacterium sp. 1MA-6-2]UJH92813.1 hypothetical protein LZ575_10525 [Antarcticibacterium sp. 1MA-6-2]